MMTNDEKYDKVDRRKRIKARWTATATIIILVGIIGISIINRIIRDPTNQYTVDKTEYRQMLSKRLNGLKKFGRNNEKILPIKQQQKKETDNNFKKMPSSLSVDERREKERTLCSKVQTLDAKVRSIKSSLPPNEFMETNESALKATRKLQDATRELLAVRYGSFQQPYRVRATLEFQETMPDFDEKGPNGSFLIEMAPADLVPHSVFTFLEVARLWQGGAFHRNAGHVLQVMVNSGKVKHLAFQEYSKDYPHKKGTVGYAGRPSGPAWYVSIQDNSRNHGPGSQQTHNPHEADSCFGRIIEGFDDIVVDRVHKMPGSGFVNDPKKHVIIKKLDILIPDETSGSYVKWHDHGAIP